MQIKTGIKRNNDGVEQEIIIECFKAFYPYERTVKKIIGIPTKKGKESAEYRKVKHELGDDWDSDLTNCWAEPGVIKDSDLQKLAELWDNV